MLGSLTVAVVSSRHPSLHGLELKFLSSAALSFLILIVTFSSIVPGFSVAVHPASSFGAASQPLQVWFEGTPQLTLAYPTNYEFNVAAKTSSGLWITSLHWDFGDGSTLDVPFSTLREVSDVRYHAYSQSGPYTVTVTAYDNTGNTGSAQQDVNWPASVNGQLDDPQASTAPTITSVSTIAAIDAQTITITGSGFGNTAPQTAPVPSGDGSVDTNACNVNTPSLAIIDSGPGSDSWSAGRETCSNTDAIGIYIQSWSDTQIVLNGFGTSLGTNGASTWNIAAGDPIVVSVWGPNENGPAQYSTTVGTPSSSPKYTVTFQEQGLDSSSGEVWSVTLNGQPMQSSQGSYYAISFTEPNGNYPYTVAVTPQGQPYYYCPSPSSGQVNVNNGNPQPVTITINSQSSPCTTSTTAPTITSVSTITATNTQTITITGSGFGTTPPQTVPVPASDGSVDTNACNVDTPSLAIIDSGPGSNSWSAGRETCSNTDSIGIYITSWSNTEIILGGFGSQLGTNGAGAYNIAAGDPIVVSVWGPNENGPAQYSTTVGSSITTSQLTMIRISANPSTVTQTTSLSGSIITVIASDQNGNPLPKVPISLTASSPGVLPASVKTGSNGQATSTLTLSESVATSVVVTVQASSGGVQSQPITVTFQPSAGTATDLTLIPYGSLSQTEWDASNPSTWVALGPAPSVQVSGDLWNIASACAQGQVTSDCSQGQVTISESGSQNPLTTSVDFNSVNYGSYGPSVVGYPNVAYGYSPFGDGSSQLNSPSLNFPIQLANFPELVSVADYKISATSASPDFDFAYDIWISQSYPTTSGKCANSGSSFPCKGDLELMIWTDYTPGIAPQTSWAESAGSVPLPTLLNGDNTPQTQTWNVWVSNGDQSSNKQTTIDFILSNPVSSGSVGVDITQIVNQMITTLTTNSQFSKYWSASSLSNYWLDQISLGSEFKVGPTNTAVYNWDLNDYCYFINYPSLSAGGSNYECTTGPPQATTVTFSASGLGSSASGPALMVDGTSYSVSQLPLQFPWTIDSSHSFSWYSEIQAGSTEEDVWQTTSGLSTLRAGTITVPSGGGNVIATYEPNYYVTFVVNPSGAGTVTPSGGGEAGISPTSTSERVLYYEGATVSISALPGTGNTFESWTSSTSSISISGSTAASTSATINGPGTITANFATSPTEGNLQVMVLSQSTGNSISGATVTMTNAPSGQNLLMGTTDSSGQYTFQGVLVGAYTVSASVQGYQANSGSGTVSNGQTRVIRITLTPTSTTYAVVFSGQDLPTNTLGLVWTVTLTPTTGNGQIRTESSNSPGNTILQVAFTGVPSGAYEFTVTPYPLPGGYYASPQTGQINVNGSTCTINYIGGYPAACLETITFNTTPSGSIGNTAANKYDSWAVPINTLESLSSPIHERAGLGVDAAGMIYLVDNANDHAEVFQ